MGRILALDYGKKRVGIAVTDPLKIIATGLTYVQNEDLLSFLKNYVHDEDVEGIVVGFPISLDGKHNEWTNEVKEFSESLKNNFPSLYVELLDERFTSKISLDAMIQAGTKKKDRQEKGNIDKTSAVIILQDYLNRN